MYQVEKVMDMLDAEKIVGTGLNATPVPQVVDFEKSPFTYFMTGAVEALQQASNAEFRTNKIIGEYLQGVGSVEDVMLATNELTISMSVATTVITTAVQTFKEIQQMPI